MPAGSRCSSSSTGSGAQGLGEAVGAEADDAALGPVERDAPAIVLARRITFLVRHRLPRDPVDHEVVECGPVAAVAPVDGDFKIGHTVEYQIRRRDAELNAAVRRADPFDDVVDVEHQIGVPVALEGIADVEAQAVERVVVPRQSLEFRNRVLGRHGRGPFADQARAETQ